MILPNWYAHEYKSSHEGGGMKWIYEGSVLSRMRGGTGHQRASQDRQEKKSCVKENVEYTVFFFSPKMTCDIFLF